MSNTFIWSIDRTLSGSTTAGQSEPKKDGNEGILRIPQSSSITETSPSDCFASYQGHLLKGSYSSAVMQSVYSTAPADWGKRIMRGFHIFVESISMEIPRVVVANVLDCDIIKSEIELHSHTYSYFRTITIIVFVQDVFGIK